jgi:putative serine protease PepD
MENNTMNTFNRVMPVIGGAIAGGVIALVIAGGSSGSHSTTTTVEQTGRGVALPTTLSSSKGLTVNQIYRQDSPGVVDIVVNTVSNNGGGFGFPGFGGGQQTQGEGAGVVYDNNGDILTDEHVVSGASSVPVHFEDGRSAGAKVLGTDPSTDVAVIHVNVPSSELHPIPLADSSAAQVGDSAVAIGSPFSLPETTTTGIVSAVGRSIQAPNQYTIANAIQTDAAINPGNSGGPLLDARGRVLGLNDQIQTNSGSSAGVGFAIPSNTVARIARQIIAGQAVRHAYVGVELSSQSTGGAQISSIQAASPASSAGLQQGDLITAINGSSLSSTEQFISKIDAYAPGDTVTLTVKRGGQTHSIKVKLGTRPSTTPSNSGG